MQVQSMSDTSPTKWHLAHTSWAFETFLLKPHLKNYRVFDSSFETLFNSYYNAIGKQFSRSHRGLLSRPSAASVFEYRIHVDNAMQDLLNNCDGDGRIENLALLFIQHEQQHQELMLTDLKHAYFQNPTFPIYSKEKYAEIPHEKTHSLTNQSEIEWFDIPSGLYQIGHRNEKFYFDNEGPKHKAYLEKYQIASRLVTNGEYLEFVNNGGYREASFWLSEAWGLIESTQQDSPLYWIKRKGQWYQFTLSGLQSLVLDEPVQHVSYFEANAYANSVNKRLPTEQEWEVASRSENRFQQMLSCLWQWTSSSYCAYPGFKVPEGAIGEYNGKFMVNQYVLRGGSKVTPEKHIRPSYRNFFYPGACWQYTGIRLAESL